MQHTSGEEKASVMDSRRTAPYRSRRSEFLQSRAPLEGLKKSRRRPAASLLRLAALSDFRPSDERQTVSLRTNLLTSDKPSHSLAGSPVLPDGLGGR